VTNPGARRYETISFDQVLADKLLVMDATAVVMCRGNQLPLRVFDLTRANALLEAMAGDSVGTLVTA
jgi:uridylate kinase